MRGGLESAARTPPVPAISSFALFFLWVMLFLRSPARELFLEIGNIMTSSSDTRLTPPNLQNY